MSGEQVRHWDRVAGGWAAWLDWTERNFQPVTDWLADAAGWTPGARVLDVACGAGYPALTAARLVHPGGLVVATDISMAMIDVTARAAAAKGLERLACRPMEAEALQFDDESFDAVTNVYGLMFSPDPARAIAEAWRVLAPGGRLAVVTWAAPDASPFFSVITAVAAPVLSLAPAQPGGPGPFRFSSATALEALLRDGGFSRVRVDTRRAVLECASADEYFAIFADVAWSARVATLSDGDRLRLREDLAQVSAPFMREGRLRLTATSLCAAGVKPGGAPASPR